MDMAGRRRAVSLALLACALPWPAQAQGTISVSGDPPPLVIAGAVAGGQPDPVTDASTTYNVVNSSANQTARIMARLDAPLPPGVTLEVMLEAPPGATSLGPVALTTVDQNLVVGVPPAGSGLGLQVSYRLTATVSAGVVGPLTRQVIFTVASP